MKKLKIIAMFMLIEMFLFSCGIGKKSMLIKMSQDYPKEFLIREKHRSGNKTDYYEKKEGSFGKNITQHVITHRKNIFQEGDTLKGKEVFFGKYIKYELWDKK